MYIIAKLIFFRAYLRKATVVVFVSLAFACNQNSTLPDPLAAGWNGSAVCEIVQEDTHLRILKCTFPPGVGHEKHKHDPHFGYALKGGRFKIIDSKGIREASFPTGYSFRKNEITEHEVLNIGDSTAVFLIIEPK